MKYVRDWGSYFGADMAALQLQGLCCSGNSGKAQHVYILRPSRGGDSVYLTYKMAMRDAAEYPRLRQIGSQYISDAHGAGQVTASSFNSINGMWESAVSYHTGMVERIHDPPSAIDMHPTNSPIRTEDPIVEPMQPSYPDTLRGVQRNIDSCRKHLAIFSNEELAPGVSQEWDSFFIKENEAIRRCASNPALPPYEGPFPFSVLMRSIIPAVSVPTPPSNQPHPVEAFDVDPVTHAGFSGTQQARLQSNARRPPALAPAMLVLLRLKHGLPVPSEHTLPVCLGKLSSNFDAAAVEDGALVEFTVVFSCGFPDLRGIWKAPSDSLPESSRIFCMPLRCILVSDLALTAKGKLAAVSLAKITAAVSAYDLQP